jgi:hemolysin III
VAAATRPGPEGSRPGHAGQTGGVKPLLRGWIHAAAAVAALVYAVAASWRSWGDLPRFASLLVFGLGMIELYTMSAVLHLGRWRERVHRVLHIVDHAGIFVFIASTYTPLCFNLLTGGMRAVILGLIWTSALAGVIASINARRIPRWVNTGLYLVMGWIVLLVLPDFLEVLPPVAVLLLLLGGLLYTFGAVVYALKRPNPFPRVLGFHEVFHIFTIAAGAVFALVVWIWVVPPAGG